MIWVIILARDSKKGNKRSLKYCTEIFVCAKLLRAREDNTVILIPS